MNWSAKSLLEFHLSSMLTTGEELGRLILSPVTRLTLAWVPFLFKIYCCLLIIINNIQAGHNNREDNKNNIVCYD